MLQSLQTLLSLFVGAVAVPAAAVKSPLFLPFIPDALLLALLLSASCFLSARFCFSAAKPVFVTSCDLLNVVFLMNRLTTNPTAAIQTKKIHISRRLATYTVLTVCLPGSGRFFTIEVAAPAPPPLISEPICWFVAAIRVGSRFIIAFWKMTPPMTTEMAVLRFRMKPKVAVAVAISLGCTSVCRAIRGDWKFGPTPIPAIIWKGKMRPQVRPTGRSM